MFNTGTIPYSVPVAPLATGCTDGCNRDGWGDNGAWWIIVFVLFFAFGGWGGNGFGWGGNNGRDGYPCATQADVRAAVDQQTLISKLDQQTYGLADTFTALNNTLNSNFRGIDNAICTLGYQNQQGFNDVSHQISDCCCQTREAIQGVNYNLATQANSLQNSMCMNTRDIIDNANANNRAILDFLVNDKLATLQAENQNLKLKASQAEQNTYLVNQLRPCPIPAYQVANPFCCYTGYQSNNACGCM